MAEEIYLSYIPFLVGTAFIIVISSLFLCRRQKSLVRPSKKAKTPYPHKWIDFNEEKNKEYKSMYSGKESVYLKPEGMIRSDPLNVVMPHKFKELVEEIWNFEVRKDDVWIVTYPKCGTTLTQEIVWQILNGVPLQSGEGKKHLFVRSPFLEIGTLISKPSCQKTIKILYHNFMEIFQNFSKHDELNKALTDTLNYANLKSSPRIIKTHLPIGMLPPNILEECKVVYVSRNVKDACVSYFHHEKLLPGHGLQDDCEFSLFSSLFMNGKLVYGSYWDHLKDGWKHRNHQNLKFLWYEDIISDLPKIIKEIATFTDKELSDEQITSLADHCHIENFKKNSTVNMKPLLRGIIPDEKWDNFNFIRKGTTGDWKNYFKDEDNLKIWNQWILENNTENIPLKFEL